MLLIYTGNGKGKTSASVGQTIRAHGQGLTVAFGQFMKRPGQAGEQKVLSIMLENRFFAGGPGFFRDEEEREKHRGAALEVLRWAEDMLAGVDMLVLDDGLFDIDLSLSTPPAADALDGALPFTGIPGLVDAALARFAGQPCASVEALLSCDGEVRAFCRARLAV